MCNPKHEKTTVLVVDDDENLRFILAETLCAEGYNVIEAENGEDALDVITRSQPDVIVLDMMMPVMDGPTFVERIKERNPKHPPIIVSSSIPHLAPKGLPIVPKPVNSKELFRALEAALS
jgi:CheY-like chemotaxis protein